MRIRLALPCAVAMIAAASCGGGESSGSGGSDNAVGTSSSKTQGDGSLQAANTNDSTADGEPISGPVVSLLSPELGLYAIDRVTNEVRDLEMDDVEFTDRQIQPILVGDSVYMLTATTLDGQFSSHEIGVGKVDLASGNGVELVRLGTDRETDEDPDPITFELVGGDASTIWVKRGPFADTENLTYLGIDASTGDGTGEFEVVPYEETTDNGSSCSGGFREAIVLEDGTMVGLTSGWPSSVDTTTGEVEPLVNLCDFDAQIDLGSLISPAELNDYVVTETGSPIPDDQAERALGVIEPKVSNGTFVAGDASLWWIFSTGTGYDGGGESLSAHAGGIVQFDLATNSIVNVWPLGSDTVTYEDSEDDITRVSTLSQADLRYLDGKLWIMDWRENAPLRVLDPSTGELTVFTIEKGDGVDFTTASLISSDPDSIWLEVTRSTITSEEGELQSSLGVNFLDQFDPASDAFTSSIKSLTIIGF